MIELALDAAAPGSVVVVEGVPGIGKSAMLAAVAGDRRRRTFAACGFEQESAFPFGVVRQLFDRAVHDGLQLEGAATLATGVLGSATGTVADVMPVFHGLYWLTSGLTEAGPITLVVDDAQWADEPSLGFLAYLARRGGPAAPARRGGGRGHCQVPSVVGRCRRRRRS